MSSDVPMYDDELKELEDQVADCIRAMDRLSGDQRLEKYSKATELLKRVNKTFHLFKVEVRMLDGADQAVYEKKAAEHSSTISQLKEQVNQKRAEVNSSPSAGAPGSPGEGGRRGDGKDEARGAANRISKTQDKTLESLKQTEQLVSETENIGQDTAQTLSKQTQQIRNINENLDQLDSEVNRAKKELNAFIRRMMTDKIILCFAVLIVIGIITIIVLRIRKGDEEDDKKATPAPGPAGPVTSTPVPASGSALSFLWE